MPRLSLAQLAALDSGVAMLEACPGSGKTRTVVQRFKVQSSKATKGIALLSFTNAAVDEATSRCLDQPQLLKSPNFVGTFDSFIHRYIVTPSLAPILRKSPTYLESWSSLSIPTTRRIWNQPGQGISLSSLRYDDHGKVFLDIDTLNHGERSYFQKLKTDADRQQLERQCIQAIENLMKKGIFDSESARAKALEILRSDRGAHILTLLARRFQEIIVDEFQDCSTVEHQIIKLLASAGIETLVVADAEQAIYEFRGATAELYEQYRASIPELSRRSLVENYRSSPVICELITSIRTGRQAIRSAGSFTGALPAHIYLLVGSDAEISSQFSALADEWMIEVSERIALAHSASDAQKLGSGIALSPNGEGTTTRLLHSLGTLRQKKSPSDRRKAALRLEQTLLDLLAWPNELAEQDTLAKLTHLDKDRVWLRSIIGRILGESLNWTDQASCKASLVSILEEEFGQLDIGFGDSSLKRKLGHIRPEAWSFWTSAEQSAKKSSTLKWSTIHGAKGNEYDAVLLKIPSPDAERAWEADEQSEEKRVFYVGASRARRLLAIAVPKSRLKAFQAKLDGFSIPHETLVAKTVE